MQRFLSPILQEERIEIYYRKLVPIVLVNDENRGFLLAERILSEVLQKETVLFLSGGKTPKDLYKRLSLLHSLSIGAVGLVDERGGGKFHSNSNERMIQETGFLHYIQRMNVPFYPILDNTDNIEKMALHYDETVQSLLGNFPKSVAVLGIGLDGHTAGIIGERRDFKNPIFTINKNSLIAGFTDPNGQFRERITMTFHGLSMIDLLLVLVFGPDKKKALEKIFTQGSQEEIPGRFYTQPIIAEKTLFITDQNI